MTPAHAPGTRFVRVSAIAALIAAAAGPSRLVAQDEPAREPQACIYPEKITRTTVLDDRNVLFFVRGGKFYLNTLPAHCPALRAEDRFTYGTTPLNGLCAGHLIGVITDLGFGPGNETIGATCKLGAFMPISQDQAQDLIALAHPSSKNKDRNNRQVIKVAPVELPPATPPQPVEPAQPSPGSAPTQPPPSEQTPR